MRLAAGIALPAVVLAIAPASAGAVRAKGADLAASLKTKLSETTGVEVTRAKCPRKVEVHKGSKTSCKITFASGDRTPAGVRFRNRSGGYDVKLRDLLMRHLEDQIEGTFADEGVTITVTCPAEPRRIEEGDQFTCDAVDANGNQGIFDITQTGDGLARYVLR